jgi:hypothetical protein
MASKALDQYKDDPRIKKFEQAATDISKKDSTVQAVFAEYKQKQQEVERMLHNDVDSANNLMALGWGSYGKEDTSYALTLYKMKQPWLLFSPFKWRIHQLIQVEPNSKNEKASAMLSLANAFKQQPNTMKFYYIWHCLEIKKLLGFLILAFAVCLGSPFWFDLLGKLMSIRGTGKKDSSSNNANNKNAAPTIIINNGKADEGAVG